MEKDTAAGHELVSSVVAMLRQVSQSAGVLPRPASEQISLMAMEGGGSFPPTPVLAPAKPNPVGACSLGGSMPHVRSDVSLLESDSQGGSMPHVRSHVSLLQPEPRHLATSTRSVPPELGAVPRAATKRCCSAGGDLENLMEPARERSAGGIRTSDEAAPTSTRLCGPGLAMAAAFIGPGSIATCSHAGAQFGFALLPVLALAIFA